ncbi:MAG: hypothetical protein GF417_08915 [Candidatus Latescibacteria bacterium]|nr:hypothetical protein [Candidatus Latescibacterota bacterium]
MVDPGVLPRKRPGGNITIDVREYFNSAIYYIRVPASRLCGNIDGCGRPAINDVTIGSDNNLKFGARENSSKYKNIAYFYRLDSDMRCYNVTFTDPYVNMYKMVFGLEGKELGSQLSTERDSMMNGLRYWDGSEWKNKPVINSRYTELLEIKAGD